MTRRFRAAAAIWMLAAATATAQKPLTPSGGDHQMYIGTYAGTIQIFDEATETKTGEIKLQTGIPRALTLSQSRSKFYVLDAQTERVEIVDIPTRTTLSTFTLSEGNKKVRIRGMQVDPILETTNFTEVDTWPLSRPIEPGLGRVNFGSVDDFNEEPGFFTGLFTTQDTIQNRRIMNIGRVNLVAKTIDLTPIGPAEGVSFAMSSDRKRAWGLVQGGGQNAALPIGRFEFWAFDVVQKKLLGRTPFEGRPRMALRVSSNGRLLYVYQAGATIDVYDSTSYKKLRTIEMNADQTTTLYILPRQ